MTTIEGNKLICDFMEDKDSIPTGEYERYVYEKFKYHDLEYNTCWDMIMPVVEKIESIGCIVEIWLSLGKGCRIVRTETKIKSWQTVMESNSTIEAVWLSVIEFVKYYNSNK